MSSSSTSSGGGPDGGSSGAGGDSGSGSGGGGPDCGPIPNLHVDGPGYIYCGFSPDAGGPLVCMTGNQCCLGGMLSPGDYAPEECSAWTSTATGCTNPVDGGIGIACDQVADCVANGVSGATVACCLQGGTAPAPDPGCTYLRSHAGTGVVCESTPGSGDATGACAAGEIQICSADIDCPLGMHCSPGWWKIFQVGFCQP